MKKLLIALVLLGLICLALCDDYKRPTKNRNKSKNRNKGDGGPCPGGFWPDGKGCCPKRIGKQFFYRDFQGCYPNSRGLYADATGCYPNSKGVYRGAGEKCPKSRVCRPKCIRPKKSKSRSQSKSKSRSQHSKPKSRHSKSQQCY